MPTPMDPSPHDTPPVADASDAAATAFDDHSTPGAASVAFSTSPPTPRAQAPRALIVTALGLVLFAGFGVGALAMRRTSSTTSEGGVRTAAAAKGSTVRVAVVGTSAASRSVTLLGEARPYAEVTLYAKTSGYLRTVNVDRGDRVHAGQVLATIESPETDRALLGARAEYEQKHVTAERVKKLLAQQFVSPQEADQAVADESVAHARMQIVEQQQIYQTLRAPFDGQVTARFADVGALMQSAANSQTAALPVVTVSHTARLRIFVYLEAGDAAAVHAGTGAAITTDARPGFKLQSRVTRVSGLLDARTRKEVAEIELDNRDGAIVPGSFVSVTLDVPITPRPEAPAEALIVKGSVTSVALVDSTGHLRIVPVHVAGNDGKLVTFADGVRVGDRVALNTGGAAVDGALVQVDKSVSASTPPSGAMGK